MSKETNSFRLLFRLIVVFSGTLGCHLPFRTDFSGSSQSCSALVLSLWSKAPTRDTFSQREPLLETDILTSALRTSDHKAGRNAWHMNNARNATHSRPITALYALLYSAGTRRAVPPPILPQRSLRFFQGRSNCAQEWGEKFTAVDLFKHSTAKKKSG